MVYRVEARGVLVGESHLETAADQGMGVVSGRFQAAPGYAQVKAIFRMYADATRETSAGQTNEPLLQQYYQARDALGLRLTDGEGQLVPTTAIHISDFTDEAGADAIEIEVFLADRSFWASWHPRS
jgi:hypothetical protein